MILGNLHRLTRSPVSPCFPGGPGSPATSSPCKQQHSISLKSKAHTAQPLKPCQGLKSPFLLSCPLVLLVLWDLEFLEPPDNREVNNTCKTLPICTWFTTPISILRCAGDWRGLPGSPFLPSRWPRCQLLEAPVSKEIESESRSSAPAVRGQDVDGVTHPLSCAPLISLRRRQKEWLWLRATKRGRTARPW